MRTTLVVLLAAALCMGQAHALYCFTCEWESSNWKCLNLTKCADEDAFCVTSIAAIDVVGWKLGKKINKKCSPHCPDSNVHVAIASYSTSCCKSSLCNLFANPALKSPPQ
ncbi:PREDICTED: lymphocyte antigen 6E-like [Gavialis gangeticus]|uniref:lymphocyte antigen 6E-like n=1 Tax=Gavialis gangeticus TaxID=94835 RepID=UPI00092F2B72|nr:PREDICTED: lymphocyte antigen 6E-like [Gavialis gangeticus]